MTPEVSAVVVNHRSALECAGCVRSLRSGFEREGVLGEIVLVDCGSGAKEVARLAELPADVLLPLPQNRGYAGGLNAGLARTRGRKLLLCNADVLFQPGALSPLCEALEDPSVGAASPRASWDAEGRILLPPGDPPGFFSDLSRLRSGRRTVVDDRRFAAFARETLRLWQYGGPARHLVGVVLAARRDVFDRVGRFDERFPFEYEETEWEDRLRGARLRLEYVAAARIRHLWARSASRNPDTRIRREISRDLYRERRYGTLGRRILEWAGGSAHPPDAMPISEPAVAARPGAWLALSPNPCRIPFAGVPLSSDFRLPGEIAERLPAGRWYFCVFREENGAPLQTFVWENAA